jgi:excisionase family DNA binding protein
VAEHKANQLIRTEAGIEFPWVICGGYTALMEAMLNTNQVAELLGMSVSTIRKWVHYGYIPHVKLGRAVRFRERDIEAWTEEKAEKGRLTLAPEIQWQ